MNFDDVAKPSPLTSEQVRAARALLQWDQRTLAKMSNVSLATIKRLEPIPGVIKANRPTLDALQRSLEQAGIIFISENGGGFGVRFERPQSERSPPAS